MDAIHVNSTAPFFARNKDREFSAEKFSLYTEIISALCWRKYNGSIYMVCDRTAAGYYRSCGIEKVWNGIAPIIPDDLEGIDADIFWAAGKLIALRDIKQNAALVDEDFIVWKKLALSETAVTCAHRENLSENIYPDPHFFDTRGLPLLEKLDMTALACNTAFLYIPDSSFRIFYASQAVAFMKGASVERSGDRLCRMVFAEQRLLAMLCAYCGIEIETLLDKDRLFVAQDDFTHIWGAKQAMRDNEDYREGFLKKCRRRIETDFPEFAYVIEAVEKYGT